jgi:hypothetical protein
LLTDLKVSGLSRRGSGNHSAYGWLALVHLFTSSVDNIMRLCTDISVLTMGLVLLWLSRVAPETRHSEGQKATAQIHFLHASIWNDDAPIFNNGGDPEACVWVRPSPLRGSITGT